MEKGRKKGAKKYKEESQNESLKTRSAGTNFLGEDASFSDAGCGSPAVGLAYAGGAHKDRRHIVGIDGLPVR